MRLCCLSCALVHAFRQQVALWDQKFSTWRWVIKKKKRERDSGREGALASSVLIAVRHRHNETQPCTNGGLAGGKQVFEGWREGEIGECVFFSFFVPKMLAFNCEIRVSFVLTRECVAGERLSYCSGDFGQESSNSGSPSTQQGFFFFVLFFASLHPPLLEKML